MLVVAQYQHQKGISGISVYATLCLLKWAGRLRNVGCSGRSHSAFPQESVKTSVLFFFLPALHINRAAFTQLYMRSIPYFFFLTPNTPQYFCSRMFLTSTMRECIAHTPLPHYFFTVLLQRVKRHYTMLNHANCRQAEVNRQALMTAFQNFVTVILHYKMFKSLCNKKNRFG